MKEQVYEFVKSIPRGKVATYGQIALHLGNRNFARVVGNILHSNPDPEHIPCHRVVNAQGRLSKAYAFGGIEAQRRLLESEGVVFKNEQVVDLSVSQMVWLALHSSQSDGGLTATCDQKYREFVKIKSRSYCLISSKLRLFYF